MPLILVAATLFPGTSADVRTTNAHRQFPGQSSGAALGAPQLHETTTQEGPFTIANQQYSVVFHYQVLAKSASRSAKTTSTLSAVEIFDAQGNSVYKRSFSYTVTQQRFDENRSASAALLTGDGGTALVIRFLEQPADSSDAESQFAKESWQLFGLVSGHLTPFGPVLPLGHGSDITVGGAVAAVMTKGGIAVMPMASTAEVVSFRAWTGNFFASVPVRFDWAHGQWGEGEECYQTADGTLTERGCIMPVDAQPQPRSPDADTLYVQLFVAPDGNTDNSQNVAVNPDSRLAFLEMQAIVQWHTEGSQGERVACSFSKVWLRASIDGKEGWVHGQDAFDALGLPLANPN
jgi:hypothetical protein